MKIRIERERLSKPLAMVNGIVEKRQTLPILGNVYIKSENGSLWLVGTDLETEVATRIEDVECSAGECTVAARKLFDICRSLPEDATLDIEGKADKVSIKAGTSRFTLQGLPPGDFPRIEADQWEHEFEIEPGVLKQLLERTAFAMAQQDVRYYLNGLLLELSDRRLRAVATDGHRLARSEVALEESPGRAQQAIVPRKAVLEMTRFLDDADGPARVALSTNHMRLGTDSWLFITKLIDGRFPDYEKVVPKGLSIGLRVKRRDFHDILNRAAILTNEKFRGVRLSLSKDRMTVTAHNPEQEEAIDQMAVEYDGGELEIGFNVGYLMEALRALENDEVEVGLQDANSSCTLEGPEGGETLYLVMPMRL